MRRIIDLKKRLREWGRYHFFLSSLWGKGVVMQNRRMVPWLVSSECPWFHRLGSCHLIVDWFSFSKSCLSHRPGCSTSPGYSRTSPLGPRKPFTERKALQDGSWLVSPESPCLPSLEVEHLIVDWFSFSKSRLSHRPGCLNSQTWRIRQNPKLSNHVELALKFFVVIMK